MELGLGGSGHGDRVGVGDSAEVVGVVSPGASSRTSAGVAQAELFKLLVSSSGGNYKPREDPGVMHRSQRLRRPQSDRGAPAQQSRLKPLSISHPSGVPVSLDGTETPGSGPLSATTTKIILESRRSSVGRPFPPGTTIDARSVWEVEGQPSWAGEPRSAPALGGLERESHPEDDLDCV